jgi:hypothetical protein
MKGIHWRALTFKKSGIYLVKLNYTLNNYTPYNSTWMCLIACFGGIGVKLTATEMRRARMMNKQMSEDCGRQHLALNRTQQHLMHHQNQGQNIHSLNFPPK